VIPYFEQPSIQLGPLTIHAFGVIVASAFAVGLDAGRRRVRACGLDAHVGEGLAWWAVVGGFLGAHLFSVLFYFPREVAANPWHLLKFWEDISSFGGIFGGLIGIALFVRVRAKGTSSVDRWRYLDVAAYVFPVSLMIGRIACSLAHDHPGSITTFPLSVSLRSEAAQTYISEVYRNAGLAGALPPRALLGGMGFHDLGWYELLYLSLVLVPLTLWLGRSPRRPGFFLLLFIGLYMPVRFALDMLRVADARYVGLTPAQWAALMLLAAWPVLWWMSRRVRETSTPAEAADGIAQSQAMASSRDGSP
jgi:phosphatidylglycerol:prolipoprotein diacylglycerol transferase